VELEGVNEMTPKIIFDKLSKLGYDRFSFSGVAFSKQITCNLFLSGDIEPSVKATSTYALEALRQALKLAQKL
jgi:hypothetical protein